MILLYMGEVNLFNEKNINECKEKVADLKRMIEEYEENYNYGYVECPNCKSIKLIHYGTYERNIIGNKEFRIKIKRVFCKECNKTHAIIPTFITPYFQSETSYINMVLFMLVVRKQKKMYLEHLLNVTRQKIRKWESRFLKHYNYLITTYKIKQEEEIFEILRQAEQYKKYKEENGIRYLEKLPT